MEDINPALDLKHAVQSFGPACMLEAAYCLSVLHKSQALLAPLVLLLTYAKLSRVQQSLT